MSVGDWTACPRCGYEHVRVVLLPERRVGFACERCDAREAYAVTELRKQSEIGTVTHEQPTG